MKLKKLRSVILFVFFTTMVLMNALTIINADNISITFWNINMKYDDVNNYEGVRIIIFFLPDCPSCGSEVGVIKEIDQNYTITVISLDAHFEPTNQTLLEFKSSYSISDDWILGYSTDQSLNKFNVTGVPTMVILDDLGRVVAVIKGESSYGFLETKIMDAVNHNTENYISNTIIEPADDELLRALFIIIGVGVSTVVLYILVKTIRRGSKETNMINALKRIEKEE